MTRRQWLLIIGINLLTALVVLSPFLPGPSSLSNLTNSIFSLAQLGSFFGLLLIPIGIFWTVNQATKNKRRILPILLWTIPAVTFIMTMWGSELARNVSRSFAITRATEIIEAVDRYHISKGHYPNSLKDLKTGFLKDIPSPSVMGIPAFNYEKNNDSYELSFTQNVLIGFNFEVVVYNSADRHKAEGEMPTLYNADRPKWKYYIYD
jgi:hypothetical protein